MRIEVEKKDGRTDERSKYKGGKKMPNARGMMDYMQKMKYRGKADKN